MKQELQIDDKIFIVGFNRRSKEFVHTVCNERRQALVIFHSPTEDPHGLSRVSWMHESMKGFIDVDILSGAAWNQYLYTNRN